ncbi:unnamed protein product [Nippostrongylus brasiliensis]|uniref:DDRGK domain-containing protein 1 n=1 Tax=Nippostrongylus brasiliensis TaxID=27835 RepID=A0A0N4XE85_NIPBR|nr:unnamed protein product [Nippostrongylus brasiliensis]
MDPPPEFVKPEAPFKLARDGIDPMLLGSVGILLSAEEHLSLVNSEARLDNSSSFAVEYAALAVHVPVVVPVTDRRVQHEDDGFMNQMLGHEDPEGNSSEEEGGAPLFGAESDEKIGKRKAAKLQAKAEKKAMREQELIEREERKRREKEREEKLEQERERERLEEEAEQERLRKEKEEREKRELEEYLALKESFAVEEEGFDQLEEEESSNLMKEFVDYVKTSKVVNMDELAAHFGLKSDEAISRLQYFLDNRILEGVMDDRGKFICITEEELNAGGSALH